MKVDKVYRSINRIPLKYIPVMILASLSINLLSLALPLTMKQIYSRIVINKSVETLSVLMIGCLIALFLEALLRKIKDSTSKWIAAKYEYQLTHYLVGKILSSYGNEIDEGKYHVNLDKFNSISRVTAFFSNSFYQLFIDLPFACLFIYLIYLLGGELFWVPVILSLIYIVIMMVNTHFYIKSKASEIEANEKVMAHLTESLEKIHLIKAAGLESLQISKYKKALDETLESNFRTNQYQMTPETISSYFSQLTLFSILIGGGYLMLTGSLNFGEITACALLGGRAISPVQNIMNLYLHYSDVNMMKNRLDQIASLPVQYTEEVPHFPEDISGTIEVIDLLYHNVQNKKAESLSCRVNSGSFIYLNPREYLSYKKLFHKIVGREGIEGGKILIDNLDIKEWNMNSLKGKVEYLSDQVNLFKGTVLENLTYFIPTRNGDAYEAATLTGLDELVVQLAEGFETQLDSQSVNTLSSAFIQRMNLTRVLLERPRILIIDPIDGSMDDETLEIFIWLLEKFKGKMTLLIATDNLRIKNLADSELSMEVSVLHYEAK